MPKTYTEQRNLYGSLTKNTSTANLALGDQLINDEYRALCAIRDFYFLYATRTITTTSGTQSKELPIDVDKVLGVTVTVGSTVHNPREVTSRKMWDDLNQSTYTSDAPEYFYVYDGKLGLWPTPATSDYVVSIYAKLKVTNLSRADYTTGTITTATAGSTSITGSGTSWAAPMAGRYIRITQTDSANTGDDNWYEIASVGSATTLTLVKPYAGASISAGSANYTIGQVSLLPDEVQDAPVYKAVSVYWTGEDAKRAKEFKELYEDRRALLLKARNGPTTSPAVDTENTRNIVNPNNYPTNLS